MSKLALDVLDDDSSCLRAIIDHARKSGFVDSQELLNCLSSRGISDQEQIEDIEALISDMGFRIAGYSDGGN